MRIIRSESEYFDKCPYADSLDLWVSKNSQHTWFFNECILDAPDAYWKDSIVIFKSYPHGAYKGYVLSVKVTYGEDKWDFKIIKETTGSPTD